LQSDKALANYSIANRQLVNVMIIDLFCIKKATVVILPLLYLSQAIKRTIDRKTVDLYALLSAELNNVNMVMNRMSSLTPPHMPQNAGQVHLIRALRSRIERPTEVRFCV